MTKTKYPPKEYETKGRKWHLNRNGISFHATDLRYGITIPAGTKNVWFIKEASKLLKWDSINNCFVTRNGRKVHQDLYWTEYISVVLHGDGRENKNIKGK